MKNSQHDKNRHCPELEKMLLHFPAWIKYAQIILYALFILLLLLFHFYMPFLF